MLKKLGIIQPGKIGDIIICLPIAKWYNNLGYKVIWPVDRNIIDNFKDYVDYVEWIPIDFDCRIAHQVCFNAFCSKVIDLAFTVTGANSFNSDNFLNKQNKYSFDEYKYFLADVPFEQKWNLQITRNEENENRLFSQLNDCKYGVIQLKSSDCSVDWNKIKIKSTYDKVVMIDNVTKSVFDWIKVLENAQFHCLIESCFVNLIDQLSIVVPEQHCLLKHGYYNKQLEDDHLRGIPRLRLNWIYE